MGQINIFVKYWHIIERVGLFQSKFWTLVLLSGVVTFSFALYFLFSAGREQVVAQDLPVGGRDGEILIYINEKGFNPEKITVRYGTQVKWVNRDVLPHRIAFTLGTSLNNLATIDQELKSGESLSFKFETVGEYAYFDKNSNIFGKVTVK